MNPNLRVGAFLLVCLGMVSLLACRQAVDPLPTPEGEVSLDYEWDLPPGFSLPPEPADNIATPNRVELGRMLFYEPLLSRDSSISCASCHAQSLAFSDGRRISPGVEGRLGTRNTPGLFNLAYQPYFFAEGGSPSLELQAIGPIETAHEMDLPIVDAASRLNRLPQYQRLATEAYGRELDPFVVTRALAAFQRTMISGDSPYDRFRQGDSSALSPEAQEGMRLFFSDRTQCGTCHAGLHLTDYQFYNVGLYAQDAKDLGRYRVTLDSADISAFKTPSLRNVALTAPYMHDGSLPDLASVIAQLDRGGEGHPRQSPLIRPLGLSEAEKADLIAFLTALTDEAFLSNPDFAAPN